MGLKVDELVEKDTVTDINANPTLAHSTPQSGKAGEVAGRELNSVSPVSEMTNAEGMSNNMATSSVSGCSSQSSSIQLSQLYQDICDQKDVIMSCLEEDNCDRDQLNAEIAKLQAMQHKYSLIEFESSKSMWLNQSSEDTSFYQDKFAQMIEAEVDRRLEAEGELRTERERQERELLLLEKEQELERLRVQHEREMYLIKKKLSSVSSPAPTKAPPCNPLTISIPRFHTVGVGKNSFVEYEVVLVELVGDEQLTWTLYRRYRQFRDLHSSLSSKYGTPVTSLTFPSRKLFGSRSEAVSSERQRDLQTYLNKLVMTCVKISSCPLHRGLNRQSLAAFATFFQTNNAESTETR